ncbi:hypothetical protein [Streptomyces sp. NPDC048350]|uniref:hypothetical protein n=1 Tax=Streptomyces sp. NPDC048350 TaxID=3365538 RepID=UPI003713AFAC
MIAVGVVGLGALCYVELAGAAPVSGSTYAYAYASLGEGAAYLDAWCLVLEYGVAVSTAAVSWAPYLNEVSDTVVGVTLPDAISGPPGAAGGLCRLRLARDPSAGGTGKAAMPYVPYVLLDGASAMVEPTGPGRLAPASSGPSSHSGGRGRLFECAATRYPRLPAPRQGAAGSTAEGGGEVWASRRTV